MVLRFKNGLKESVVAQSCLDLCDSVGCSPQGSFVHGILQARILEWFAITFSRGSSQLRDRTWISWVSLIAGRYFTIRATREHGRGEKKRGFEASLYDVQRKELRLTEMRRSDRSLGWQDSERQEMRRRLL